MRFQGEVGVPTVLITASTKRGAERYAEAVARCGGEARLALSEDGPTPAERLLEGVGGLLLSGGPDVHPHRYGEEPDPNANLELAPERDELDFSVLRLALERDMPVLTICRGMQLLNVALGGKLVQDLPKHHATRQDGSWVSAYHHVFISPGSRLASLVGAGGFCRVNSRHHQGFRDGQRAKGLMASAYSLEDHLVEGVESTEYAWVIGVQCHPERVGEVPKSWDGLFYSLVGRAGEYAER